MREATVTTLLFIVGAANAMPLVGVLGAERLAALYGVQATDPGLLLLLQHRALLFGLLGAFIMYAAFRSALRGLALVAALASMLSFVALAVLTAPHHALIGRVVVADLVLSVLLLPAVILHVARPRQVYRTETIS